MKKNIASVEADHFDECKSNNPMVYHEMEAHKWDVDSASWSGPIFHFTKPSSIPKYSLQINHVYVTVWEDELDQTFFADECKRKLNPFSKGSTIIIQLYFQSSRSAL